MSDIWYEEDLVPDTSSVERLVQGVKSPDERQRLELIRRKIRIHRPRWKILSSEQVSRLDLADRDKTHLVIRFGCDLDPYAAQTQAKGGFSTFEFKVYLRGEQQLQPRVYALQPVSLDKGKPSVAKLHFSPSIIIDQQIEASMGSIEHNLEFGMVAPIIRGFPGENEREPYWRLRHHRESILYGTRHFWLCVELPRELPHLRLMCYAEGTLQTRLGELTVVTQIRDPDLLPVTIISSS